MHVCVPTLSTLCCPSQRVCLARPSRASVCLSHCLPSKQLSSARGCVHSLFFKLASGLSLSRLFSVCLPRRKFFVLLSPRLLVVRCLAVSHRFDAIRPRSVIPFSPLSLSLFLLIAELFLQHARFTSTRFESNCTIQSHAHAHTHWLTGWLAGHSFSFSGHTLTDRTGEEGSGRPRLVASLVQHRLALSSHLPAIGLARERPRLL